MLKAYDKILELEVTAKVAAKRAVRGDKVSRYRCPGLNCKADVYIRRLLDGPIFAHMPNQAAADCNEYFGTNAASAVATLRQRPALNEIDQLRRPGLELFVDASMRSWRLTYFLPRHTLSSKSFRINVAPNSDSKRISAAALADRPLRFDAVPSQHPIGLSIDNDDAIDEHYFYPRAFCLSNTGLNVFHAAGVNHHHRAVGPHLYWGTSYFVIWDGAAQITIPERISNTVLPQSLRWCCALIRLPSRPVEALRAFIETATALTIISKKATVQVIYPHSSRDDTLCELALPECEEILLSISRKTSEPLKDGLLIEGKGGPQFFDLGESPTTFVRLQPSAPKAYYLVRYASEPAVLIHMDSQSETTTEAALVLEVRDPTSGLQKANFFSLRAHKLLDLARRGIATDARLLANAPVQGTVSLNSNAGWSRSKVLHLQVATNVLVPIKGIDLSSLLRLRDTELILNFGALGFQYVRPLPRLQRPSALAESVVARLRFVINMARITDGRLASEIQSTANGNVSEAIAVLTRLTAPAHLRLYIDRLLMTLRAAA